MATFQRHSFLATLLQIHDLEHMLIDGLHPEVVDILTALFGNSNCMDPRFEIGMDALILTSIHIHGLVWIEF